MYGNLKQAQKIQAFFRGKIALKLEKISRHKKPSSKFHLKSNSQEKFKNHRTENSHDNFFSL
jgi:hypothetical protein